MSWAAFLKLVPFTETRRQHLVSQNLRALEEEADQADQQDGGLSDYQWRDFLGKVDFCRRNPSHLCPYTRAQFQTWADQIQPGWGESQLMQNLTHLLTQRV